MFEFTEKNVIQQEEKSNPAVVAIGCNECPLPEQGTCFYVATGFGGAPYNVCKHMNEEKTGCAYPIAHEGDVEGVDAPGE